jgi:hypothetical protein
VPPLILTIANNTQKRLQGLGEPVSDGEDDDGDDAEDASNDVN